MLKSRIVVATCSSAALIVLLGGCSGGSDGEKSEGSPPKSTSSSKSAPAEPLPYELDRGTASAIVNAKRFGDSWPLTVSSGIVNCSVESNGVAVIFQPDDESGKYALNGYAKGSETMEFYGLELIDPIWKDDPATGAKKDIGVLIDICQPYFK